MQKITLDPWSDSQLMSKPYWSWTGRIATICR